MHDAFAENASGSQPVGAPTLSDEQIDNVIAVVFGEAYRPHPNLMATHRRFARALLFAQGCELATDATKQQREKSDSVHLSGGLIGQDFRDHSAQSTSAPCDEGSEREAFEAWACGEDEPHMRLHWTGGSYDDQQSETAWQAWRSRAKQLNEALQSCDFYKRRCDLLQEWQSRMRDPERTIVCDILANAQTLSDPKGERYGPATLAREPL